MCDAVLTSRIVTFLILPDVGDLFLIVLVSYCSRAGLAPAQAANIFYCAFGVVKAMTALRGCDISRIGVRHSPFWADGI
jgi:hypothetical protein